MLKTLKGSKVACVMWEETSKRQINQLLSACLEENLVAAYTYGEKDRLLIILNKADINSLDDIKAVKTTFKHLIKAVKIFTLSEFEHSLDVFPMEFLDIFETHDLVAGAEILGNYKISKGDLRHECEFYLRSQILKLRQAYMREKAYLDAIMIESLPGFMAVFKQLGKLMGLTQKFPNRIEFIKAFSEKSGVDAQVFIQILDPTQRYKSLDEIFPDYLGELTKIIEKVDSAKI